MTFDSHVEGAQLEYMIIFMKPLCEVNITFWCRNMQIPEGGQPHHAMEAHAPSVFFKTILNLCIHYVM